MLYWSVAPSAGRIRYWFLPEASPEAAHPSGGHGSPRGGDALELGGSANDWKALCRLTEHVWPTETETNTTLTRCPNRGADMVLLIFFLDSIQLSLRRFWFWLNSWLTWLSRIDSNQLMTRNGFLEFDSNLLMTQIAFQNFDSSRLATQ